MEQMPTPENVDDLSGEELADLTEETQIIEEQAQPAQQQAQPVAKPQEFQRWDAYRADPAYNSLSVAQKQGLFDSWREYATKYMANTGVLSTEADIDYAKDYFDKAAQLDNLKKPRYEAPSYTEELIGQAQSGLNALQAGSLAYGAASGFVDTDSAARAIVERRLAERDRYINPTLQAYGQKQQGFFGSFKDMVSSPVQIIGPMFAQSIGSNLPAIGASLTAGAIGTAIGGPGVGAAAALNVGAFAGGGTDTLVNMDQLLSEEMQKRGLDQYNPADVKSVLEDTEWAIPAKAASEARGVAIGATQYATLGFGRLASAPLKVLEKEGLKGFAKEGLKQTAIQIAGEPVSEIAAQKAEMVGGRSGNIRWNEVAEELVVGLPVSAVEAGGLIIENLNRNNSPSTADEVNREAVQNLRQGDLTKLLSQPLSDAVASQFYDVLNLSQKSRVLGLADNAILTEGQGTYGTLSEQEKSNVQQAFNTARAAVTPEAEVAPTPAPTEPVVAEVAPTPAPELEPTVAQVEEEAKKLFEEPTPAVVGVATPQQITPDSAETLVQTSPATATVVAEESRAAKTEEPAPVEQPKVEAPAPTPVQPTPQPLTKKFLEEGIKNVTSLESMSRFFNEILEVLGRPPTKEEEAGLAAFIEGRIDVNGLPASLISEEQIPVSQPTDFSRLRQTVEKVTGEKVTPVAPAPVAEAPAPAPVTPTSEGVTVTQDADGTWGFRWEHEKFGINAEGIIQQTVSSSQSGFSTEEEALRLAKEERQASMLNQITQAEKVATGLEERNNKGKGDARQARKQRRAAEETKKLYEKDYPTAPTPTPAKPQVEAPVAVSATAPQAVTPPATPTVPVVATTPVTPATPVAKVGSPQDVAKGWLAELDKAKTKKDKLNLTTFFKDKASSLSKLERDASEIFKTELYKRRQVAPTPITQKLPPTKTQAQALTKLGYLPADIEALDRVKAKDILSNKTPKTPIEKTKKETETVVAPKAEPTTGEAGQPLAPAKLKPAPTNVSPEEGLDKTQGELQKQFDDLAAELLDMNLDEASVQEYFKGVEITPLIRQRLQALMRIVTLGLSNARNDILKKSTMGKGRETLAKAFAKKVLNKVVFVKQRGGSGVYADPRNLANLDTLFVDPSKLFQALMSNAAVDPADFFVKALQEEIIHMNDGLAMLEAFRATKPAELTQEAYEKFYDANNKEVEDSLTLDQIKDVLSAYADSLGISFEGKTKEEIVSEFNVGRPGRLGEEYLRAITQRRESGQITEDQVKKYATRPILRTLAALRDRFLRLIGNGTKARTRKSFIDVRSDAIVSLLANAPTNEKIAAGKETNVIIPRKDLASTLTLQELEELDVDNKLNEEIDQEVMAELAAGMAPDGLIRRLVVGGLKRSFRGQIDSDFIEQAVLESLASAATGYDATKGAKPSTRVFKFASRKIIDELRKIEAGPEFVSFNDEFATTPFDLKVLSDEYDKLKATAKSSSEVSLETLKKTGEERVKTRRARGERKSVTPEETAKGLEKEVRKAERVGTKEVPETRLGKTFGETDLTGESTAQDGTADDIESGNLAKQTAIVLDPAEMAQRAEVQNLVEKANLTSFEADALAYSLVPESENEQGELVRRPRYTADTVDSVLEQYSEPGKILYPADFYRAVDSAKQKIAKAMTEGGIKRSDLFAEGRSFASSIDILSDSRALNRAIKGLDPAVAAVLSQRKIVRQTRADVLKRANDFVSRIAPTGNPEDVVRAKTILDSTKGLETNERNVILGVILAKLRDATLAVNAQIKAKGNSPELSALAEYLLSNSMYIGGQLSVAGTTAGRDLGGFNIIADFLYPLKSAKMYTDPVFEKQKETLGSKDEVQQLLAEIQKLKSTIAGQSADNSFNVGERGGISIGQRPPTEVIPEGENFYKLLSVFGDMAPTEGEDFISYLNRIGISYNDLIGSLEGIKAASVSPGGVDRVLPVDLKAMSATDAIKALIKIDPNLFSKMVKLRVQAVGTSTNEDLKTNFDIRKASPNARQEKIDALQGVFDFFDTVTAEQQATEKTMEEEIEAAKRIEETAIPPVVRLAKYAADTITQRVLRSLGVNKKATEKAAFDQLESQVRKIVNAQMKQELDPKKVSPEDTRTLEEMLVDIVQRITLAEEVFNQVQANLQVELSADNELVEGGKKSKMSEERRAYIESMLERKFDANATKSIDTLLRNTIDFKAEARKHMTQRGATLNSIQQLINQKFPNLREEQVVALAKVVAARYTALVKERAQKQLENITRRIGEKATAMPKSKVSQLLELVNLGAFSEEKFYNAIAERYDIPEWDPVVAQEIIARANQVSQLPEGSDQRLTAAIDLTAYIAQEVDKQRKGWEKVGKVLEVMASLWKAGVLSGPPTQLVNLGATHINVLFELTSEAKGYAQAAKKAGIKASFGDFFGQAYNAYVEAAGRLGVEEAGNALATGLTRFRSENNLDLNPLEKLNKDPDKPWSFNNYAAAWKLVGRVMAAADTYNSVIANEAKARMEARYVMLKQGLTAEQATQKADEIFSRTSGGMKAIQKQVNDEESLGQFGTLAGLTPDTKEYKSQKRKIDAGKNRRFNQLRERYVIEQAGIGQDGITKMREFAQKATFNGQPKGSIGYLMDAVIGNIAGKVPILTPFAAFPRTIANIVNSSIDYTPYGWLRANGFSIGNISGAIRDSSYKYTKPEKGSVEYYQLRAKALYGSIVMASIIGLAIKDRDKDWDEAFFAVTGRGPSDRNKREQLRATGWTENTVKIGSIRFKHTDFPGLNLLFGALATVSDAYRYEDLDEATLDNVMFTSALSVANSVVDKNLLSGAKTLFDAVSDRGSAADRAKRVLSSYTGAYLNPGIARWLSQTIPVSADGKIRVVDTKTQNATMFGWLIGQTPIAVYTGVPMLNRLGEEVRNYPWSATTKRFGFIPDVKPHPVITPLVQEGLVIPGISAASKITVFKRGVAEKRRLRGGEEFYQFSKYNGEYMGRVLTASRAKSLASLARENRELAQKELSDLATKANDYAKARLEASLRRTKR